jgi:hypothetical protein
MSEQALLIHLPPISSPVSEYFYLFVLVRVICMMFALPLHVGN